MTEGCQIFPGHFEILVDQADFGQQFEYGRALLVVRDCVEGFETVPPGVVDHTQLVEYLGG